MAAVEPGLQMWLTLALVAGAIAAFAQTRIPMEFTALALLAALGTLFFLAPLEPIQGKEAYGIEQLFAGFANPALIAVVSLLVVGQGLINTGALEAISQRLFRLVRLGPGVALTLSFASATAISAVLNDTPVVVMFIPIMVALAERLRRPADRVLLPLSYVAILGGITTLIGSSTNLLAAGTAAGLGAPELGFFDFTVPGIVVAALGFPYAVFVVPRLLGRRTAAEGQENEAPSRQFVAHFQLAPASRLVGQSTRAGLFAALPEMTVLAVSRDFRRFLPPFERLVLRSGDILTVAATRKVIVDAFHRLGAVDPLASAPEEPDAPAKAERRSEDAIAEAVVAPASRLVGQPLVQADLRPEYRCALIGVERRSGMSRAEIADYRLEAGDVLLIRGRPRDFRALRASHDILLLERSMTDLPLYHHAQRAAVIFAAVVAAIASGAVPTALAAFLGAVAMIAAGCLNLRQAFRAIDRRVVLIIVSAVALGGALQATGGALYIAKELLGALEGASPAVVLSAFFLLIALFTNVLSNNACAVLFTPIAVEVARRLGVDPLAFVVAVIFASNCSFATPIGYQTNLLVMAPGHYRFADYLKAGAPLVLIVWAAFSLFAPWYYGLY